MKHLVPLVLIPASAILLGTRPTLSDDVRSRFFSADAPDFLLESNRDRFLYRVNGVFLMPGETFEARVTEPDPIGAESFVFETAEGIVEPSGPRAWRWRAPAEPGLYPVRVKRAGSRDGILLNVFVMVPVEEVANERLSGYRIGS